MSSSKSPRTLPAFGEFALIVVGVLVALWAESWWAEREDRAAERQILLDAISEFQENIEILDLDIARNIVVFRSLTRIEEMTDAELLALSDEEASELFAIRNHTNAGFDPAMGSIDALVRNGDVRFITDPELRQHLARWSALITRSTRMDLQHGKFLLEGIFMLVPAFKADGKWTSAERREVSEQLSIMKITLELCTDTMVELRATADEIVDRLAELTN